MTNLANPVGVTFGPVPALKPDPNVTPSEEVGTRGVA